MDKCFSIIPTFTVKRTIFRFQYVDDEKISSDYSGKYNYVNVL